MKAALFKAWQIARPHLACLKALPGIQVLGPSGFAEPGYCQAPHSSSRHGTLGDSSYAGDVLLLARQSRE